MKERQTRCQRNANQYTVECLRMTRRYRYSPYLKYIYVHHVLQKCISSGIFNASIRVSNENEKETNVRFGLRTE